jgi:hypothetical protein
MSALAVRSPSVVCHSLSVFDHFQPRCPVGRQVIAAVDDDHVGLPRPEQASNERPATVHIGHHRHHAIAVLLAVGPASALTATASARTVDDHSKFSPVYVGSHKP